MLKIASVLAIAAAALALPVAAADKPATDKAVKPADSSQLPTQEQIIERTGNETRVLPPPKKMTKEEKAADKKAKRTGTTPEEQQRQNTRSPG